MSIDALNRSGLALLADMPTARATRMAPAFAAWRVCGGRVYPLPAAGATLADVVADAAPRCDHKEQLLVRETDPVRGAALHVYQIKRKSAPRYVHADYQQRRVNDLYAEEVMTLPVEAFEPVERGGVAW